MDLARRLAWVAGFLAIVLGLTAAGGAYFLAQYSWDQVVSYRSPYADYDRSWVSQPAAGQASAEATPSAPHRLVLVVIDGLTLEASQQEMGSLNTLRQYGADLVAITPQPSLSYPTWTNILSGAPPQTSAVTTNWFEEPVPVETIFDVAVRAGLRIAVSGPDDLATLFLSDYISLEGTGGAEPRIRSYLAPWDDDGYVASRYVDEAVALADRYEPQLLVVHLPDTDEAAHDYGADSGEYREIVGRIDRDVARLVENLQDDRTTFVITADHGHVDAGGHGGWEPEATRVPVVFVGRGVASLTNETVSQSDIAPTVAALLGVEMPRHADGRVLPSVLTEGDGAVRASERQRRAFSERYVSVVSSDAVAIPASASGDQIDAAREAVTASREKSEQQDRLPIAAGLAGACLLALIVVFATSWRAGISATLGTVAYYAVYNGAYFLLHGHAWSLSAFNTEENLSAFFNLRMIEAAAAALVAVAVAALVYPLLRAEPKGPRRGYLGGWLALGPATVLTIQATIGIQIAWFLWWWGAKVTWRLPDLGWGFKYDLDLIQVTALGAAMVLAPLVSYGVGRLHPKVRRFEKGA